jgi:hypothetical protein
LEILVNGGHVTSFVRNLGNQRFLASFVPHEALSHLVEMKFNGETVPGKFIICRKYKEIESGLIFGEYFLLKFLLYLQMLRLPVACMRMELRLCRFRELGSNMLRC